jgi:hypothetical protein
MNTSLNIFPILIAPLTLIVLFFWPSTIWTLLLLLPLLLIGLYDRFKKKHAIRRNFPLFGRVRWIMETLRPYIRQYFVESDTDGVPVNRMFRNVVYQRAKNALSHLCRRRAYGHLIGEAILCYNA